MNRKSESSPASAVDWPDVLTKAALILALVLVAVRITILEVVREAFSTSGAAEFGLGPGPTTTLILDLFCWLPALLVLIRRAIDPRYTLRLHVSHLLMALLAGWVAISCFWASDKFQAIVTASTWCAAMSLGWAMCQLVRSWTRFRLVVSVAIGLLLIFLAQAAIYRLIEWPTMVEDWDRIKDQALQQRGWSPDDFLARQFDAKIRRGEMIGFFRSPNTYAAVAAMGALVALGMGAQRLKDKDSSGLSFLILVPAALSIGILVLTGSRTAMAGFALCVLLFFLAKRFSDRLSKRSKPLFLAACALAALLGGAVVGVGLLTGGLLHDSLNFRWNYWVASWSVFRQHPITGVGWSNFANAYLQFRLPAASEEIKDPHNFIVKFLAETGVVGAVLAMAWIGRSAWEATRPVAPRDTNAKPAPATAILLLVPIGFVLLRLIVGWPVSLAMPEAPKLLLFGFLLAFGLIVSSVRSTTDLNADHRPAPLALLGTLLALTGFLLHGLVDFAMFEIGPLLLMMLLLGAVLGARHPGAAGRKQRTPIAIGALAAVFLGLTAFLATIVIPIISAESKAAESFSLADRKQYPAAATTLREAYFVAPVRNADYMSRCARYLQLAQASPSDVLGVLTLAIDADPSNPLAWLDRARFRRRLADNELNAPRAVMDDYLRAVTRDPTDVEMRLEYAQYLDSAGKSAEAVAQYRQAMESNDKLNPDEPRRLPQAQVDEIRKLIEGK